MISHSTGFSSLLGLFVISSVLFTCTLLQLTLSLQGLHSTIQQANSGTSHLARTQIRDDYTYVDDDFPPRLLDFEPGHVQLAVEESVRFSLWDPESPAEWTSTSPPGEGSVRLGRDGRVFYLSMFHELHCLRRIEKSLRDPQSAAQPGVLAHTQHCLNYLRQWSLCQADRTLEVGDFVARNFTADRVGPVHMCGDWRAVYDRVTYEWKTWKDAASQSESSRTASSE